MADRIQPLGLSEMIVVGPPGESLIGTVLSEKYRLDALIGRGGFGAVYRGWHLLLDVAVAVKIAFRVDGGLGRRSGARPAR